MYLYIYIYIYIYIYTHVVLLREVGARAGEGVLDVPHDGLLDALLAVGQVRLNTKIIID